MKSEIKHIESGLFIHYNYENVLGHYTIGKTGCSIWIDRSIAKLYLEDKKNHEIQSNPQQTQFITVDEDTSFSYDKNKWEKKSIEDILNEKIYQKVIVKFHSIKFEKTFSLTVQIDGYVNFLDFVDNFATRLNDLHQENVITQTNLKDKWQTVFLETWSPEVFETLEKSFFSGTFHKFLKPRLKEPHVHSIMDSEEIMKILSKTQYGVDINDVG